jgi:hypothetical protein
MFDPALLAEATKLAQTSFTPPAREGERAAISASVAASLRLEGIDATPESVLEAADADPQGDAESLPHAAFCQE